MKADLSHGFDANLKINKCTQTFRALDDWLQESATTKGEASMEDVRRLFHNDLRANIHYYNHCAMDFEANNEKELAAKYRLIGKLYEGILAPK